MKGNRKNCNEKKQMKNKKDINGDGLCDVTGNSIKNHARKCNEK